MKRFSGRFLLCTALIYLIVACATSPTGRRQFMIVSEESAIASSKQAYVEMLKSYEQQGKIDNDKALKDRVHRITGHLMAQVGGKGPPEFLSTHPAPANREKTLAALAPQMMPYYEKKGERPIYKL